MCRIPVGVDQNKSRRANQIETDTARLRAKQKHDCLRETVSEGAFNPHGVHVHRALCDVRLKSSTYCCLFSGFVELGGADKWQCPGKVLVQDLPIEPVIRVPLLLTKLLYKVERRSVVRYNDAFLLRVLGER